MLHALSTPYHQSTWTSVCNDVCPF